MTMEIDANGSGSTTAVASVLNIGNLTINSGKDVLLEGSEINAGTASIDAEGSVTVKSAEETSYEYSFHEKTTVSLDKDFAKSAAQLFTGTAVFDPRNYQSGRMSLTVGSGEYENKKTKTESTTQSASNLYIDGDFTVESGNDITISGSNLEAGGDVTLSAVNNVSIEAAKETTKTETETMSGKAELSVGVSNSVASAGYAAKAVKEAKEAVEAAKDSYDKYKESMEKAREDLAKGLIDKSDYEDMTSEENFYKANIALATEGLVQKTAAFLQATSGAAGTAGTFGFSADAQLKIDAMVEKTLSESTTSVSSTVKAGGNFTVTAGGKAKIEGSDVQAGKDILLDANSVDIIASENTSKDSSKKFETSLTISVSTSGATGPSINGTGSVTDNGTTSTTYNNSSLNGANITIISKEDTKVSGAEVKAEEKLTLNVGGDLTVESLQDKTYTQNMTLGGNAGSSGSGGVNGTLTKDRKEWVKEQTSLTGGVVNIYVEDKTTLIGAVIASDTPSTGSGAANNLIIDTGSFEYSDIKDKDKHSTIGGGATTGGGSSSANANFDLSDKRQTNFATIGEGTVTVRASAGSASEADTESGASFL